MKSAKPELLSLTGFYVAGSEAFMPAMMDTDAGYFIEKEPVLRFDPFNSSALAKVLENSLSEPNTVIPASKFPPEDLVLSPYLNVSSQNELEKKTVYVSVVKLNTGFRIESQQRKSDGTWDRKDKAIDEVLPETATYGELADRIIAYLKTRKDIPA